MILLLVAQIERRPWGPWTRYFPFSASPSSLSLSPCFPLPRSPNANCILDCIFFLIVIFPVKDLIIASRDRSFSLFLSDDRRN